MIIFVLFYHVFVLFLSLYQILEKYIQGDSLLSKACLIFVLSYPIIINKFHIKKLLSNYFNEYSALYQNACISEKL